MEVYKVVNEAIRKLEIRIKDCKKNPQANESYIEGLEHAIRFIKLELYDAILGDKE